MAMNRINKKYNEYAEALDPQVYEGCPKAVLAAIAVSLLTCGGDTLADGDVTAKLAAEWDALHLAGIVPQRPSKAARALLAALDDT